MVLISVLAATDALWQPYRDWGNGAAQVIDERRLLYREAGVPWSAAKIIAGIPDDADRKALNEALARLDVADLIVVGNPTGLRTTTLKLTTAGDDRARGLVGLCHLADAFDLLRDLVRLREDPGNSYFLGNAWTPETKLAGVEWGVADTTPFADVQCALLPALCRGFVEASSDPTKHVWYRIAPGGVELANKGEPVQPKMPRMRSDAETLYLARIRQARAELYSISPSRVGGIGLIPFPSSIVHRHPITPEVASA